MKTDDTEVARLVVFNLPTMAKAQRKKLARWLMSRAKVIDKFSDIQVTDYAGRFTQRLYSSAPARGKVGAGRRG